MPFEICARDNCENVAEYYPNILMYPTGDKKRKLPASAIMALPLCKYCMLQTLPRDIINEEWWKKTNLQFDLHGRPRPKRNLTRIEWVRIEDAPEALRG